MPAACCSSAAHIRNFPPTATPPQFDWSNDKAEWAAAKPMDCEERLVTQVQLTTAARRERSPGTTVFVYRNAIKALPWYTLVRNKITDPAYAPWFMRFGPPTIGSGWHVPQCDLNYDPPLCSDFYRGQRGPLRRIVTARQCSTPSFCPPTPVPLTSLCRPGANPSENCCGRWLISLTASVGRTLASPPPPLQVDPLKLPNLIRYFACCACRATPLATATARRPPVMSALCLSAKEAPFAEAEDSPKY